MVQLTQLLRRILLSMMPFSQRRSPVTKPNYTAGVALPRLISLHRGGAVAAILAGSDVSRTFVGILARPDGQRFGDYGVKSATGKTYRVAMRGPDLRGSLLTRRGSSF